MRCLIVSAAELVGLFIVFSVLQAFSPKSVYWLSLILVLVAVWVLFSGRYVPRIQSRGKALATLLVAGICFLAISTKFQHEQQAALAKLKVSDPIAYREELKRVNLNRWLEETRAIDKDAYLVELKKVDEEKWFNELLELKPDEFLKEAGARRKRACNDDRRLGEAYVMIQDNVRSRLKAPATADFPWKYSNGTRHIGDCVYVVIGHVDAQNSFGALLRANFTGRIEYFPKKGAWRTLTVSVDG